MLSLVEDEFNSRSLDPALLNAIVRFDRSSRTLITETYAIVAGIRTCLGRINAASLGGHPCMTAALAVATLHNMEVQRTDRSGVSRVSETPVAAPTLLDDAAVQET